MLELVLLLLFFGTFAALSWATEEIPSETDDSEQIK